jgi:23S rRNA pseudouridine1911/1915/1917 synthase
MNVSSKVPGTFDGIGISDYLARRFTYLPKESWRRLLQQGRIRCNGVVCDESAVVARGDAIRCELPVFESPHVNFDYKIVYEDEWLLGVNKPPGLRVHSMGKFVNANLVHHLRHVRQPARPEVDLINRLDADTSGLLLLARDKTVLGQLLRQFAAGTVEKRYLAVVHGRPCPAAGTINLPIGQVEGARVPRYGVTPGTGKRAVSHYRTIREFGKRFTLLELSPATGRTHQLRVHLAAIGHAIAGDALYTMSDEEYLDWRRHPTPLPTIQRQALHSWQLRFFHPVREADCTIYAPLPPDMARFIQKLAAA